MAATANEAPANVAPHNPTVQKRLKKALKLSGQFNPPGDAAEREEFLAVLRLLFEARYPGHTITQHTFKD